LIHKLIQPFWIAIQLENIDYRNQDPDITSKDLITNFKENFPKYFYDYKLLDI